MSVVQNIRLNAISIATYNAYHSYTTSAIPTDTERYVFIDPEEVENIKKREQTLNIPESNKLARELQERLVQCCIDYIKETGDTNIDRVIFTADALQESSKYGSWQACTDSTCELEKLTEDGYENISFSA